MKAFGHFVCATAASAVVFLAGFLLIPTPRFDSPRSTVVCSAEGQLLGARIADDGQWRFPLPDVAEGLPDNYVKALLTFEDRWFYLHPGINPVAILRAARQDLSQGRIVSGGSTLTMQVARMYRNQPRRTLWGKGLEALMALKLERVCSKDEILALYAANAPFGGNVVGVETAAWRYFRRPAAELSWAEAATLAILPNAPSRRYPGRNDASLLQTRNRLLRRLCSRGYFDELTLELSLEEPLPEPPGPMPDEALHLVERCRREHPGERCRTLVRSDLQHRGMNLVRHHRQRLARQGINNLAALIWDVAADAPVMYIGNGSPEDYVDVITAPRSSGSILKPFLYAALLDDGEITPAQLVADIPVNFSGYMPRNFDLTYSGAVPADEALARSLNIPAVEMLYRYTPARFLDVLRDCGFSTFTHGADHYGLSLMLGGGEITLEELARAYASLARGDRFSPGASWFTLEALGKVNRPEERSGWKHYASARRLAWKTGTSFGQRDAWAVGVTPQYVVAVWAGNDSGEGSPALSGTASAAPLLFDLADLLPSDLPWFSCPEEDLIYEKVCLESGYKASALCPHTEERAMPRACAKTSVCPWHKMVHLDQERRHQVSSACYPVERMVHDTCFVLPPAMEWYYRQRHPEYRVLPPAAPQCADASESPLELLYPRELSRIYLPTELDGSRGAIVVAVAHRNMNVTLYWHLDDRFLGTTATFHQMALSPAPGTHRLTVVDPYGHRLERSLTILN